MKKHEEKTEKIVKTKTYRIQAITGEITNIKIDPDRPGDQTIKIINFLETLGLHYPLGLMPNGIQEIRE